MLVAFDLLYVTQGLRDAVLAGVQGIGLSAGEIFMAASHTHYAPAIDSTKPLLGTPDSECLDRVAETAVEAIRDAVLGSKEEVNVEVRWGRASIGVNRRKKRAVRILRRGVELNRVGMCPNPAGPTDPVASVVSFNKANGQTIAYLWSAACHPTGYPEATCVSAHWPGVVRNHLRELQGGIEGYGDPVPVLFLQGFSGDVRPPSGSARKESGQVKAALNRLRLGATFGDPTEHEYEAWTSSAAHQVAEIATLPAATRANGDLDFARMELPASRFARGADGLPPVSFHSVSIGPVTIVGASAELVSGYAAKVRALAPDRHVIPVGCIDHVIGYWPLQRMFREGGYEVVHHCPSFGIKGCAPDIEATVMEQFAQLLHQRSQDDQTRSYAHHSGEEIH